MRPILRAVLATKIGQVPAVSYIKRVKNIQAKSHVSKWLLGVIVKIPNRDEIISWSEKTALFRFAPLVSQPSLSSTYCPYTPLPHLCIHSDILCHQTNKVPPWSWMCVVYRQSLPLLWNLFRFSSFSVTVHMNVNKLLCLESLIPAVLQITRGKIPRPSSSVPACCKTIGVNSLGTPPPPSPHVFLHGSNAVSKCQSIGSSSGEKLSLCGDVPWWPVPIKLPWNHLVYCNIFSPVHACVCECDWSPDFTIMEEQYDLLLWQSTSHRGMPVINSLAWHSLLICNWNLTVGMQWRCYAQVWNWFQVPPIPFLSLVHPQGHTMLSCKSLTLNSLIAIPFFITFLTKN